MSQSHTAVIRPPPPFARSAGRLEITQCRLKTLGSRGLKISTLRECAVPQPWLVALGDLNKDFSMRLLAVFALVALLCASAFGVANAQQGCPENFVPNPNWTQGQAQCIPGPPSSSAAGGSSYHQLPEPKWDKRWGAFASDPITSKVGVAVGMESKRDAEKAAIDHCRSKGGQQCRTLLAYFNQCAAVAWGPDSSGTGDLISVSAARKDAAEFAALKECSTNSTACKIFFSECSYAERVE